MADYQGRVKTGFFPQHAYSGAMRVGSHQPLLPLSVTDAGAMSGGQEGARLDVSLPSQLGIHAVEFSKYFSVCFEGEGATYLLLPLAFWSAHVLGVLVRRC